MAYGFNDDKSKEEMYSKTEIDNKIIMTRKLYTAQSSSPNIVYSFSELGLDSDKKYFGIAGFGMVREGVIRGWVMYPVNINEITKVGSIQTALQSGQTVDIRFVFFAFDSFLSE